MDPIPRCSHGKILLACPDEQCPEQNDYLAEREAAMQRYYDRQMADARTIVRRALGIPD